MRDLTVTDDQGAVEYQIVDLTRKNWYVRLLTLETALDLTIRFRAWLAQQKISADRSKADKSRLLWQINRLEKMNILAGSDDQGEP